MHDTPVGLGNRINLVRLVYSFFENCYSLLGGIKFEEWFIDYLEWL